MKQIDLYPRVEKRRLSSTTPDNNSLMYPGTQLFIWIRPLHFPWLLAGFGPLEGAHGEGEQSA